MATVIDALLVTVGLDTSGYKKGEKEVDQSIDKTKERAQKGARDIEQSGKRGAEFFKGMRNEALKLAGALLSVRSISNFIGQITSADAATGRLAENIGMSARELFEFEQIVQRFGGTASQVDGDLRSLNQTVTQWRLTGNAPIPLLQALSAAHIDVSQFIAESTPMVQRLMMFARAIKALKPTERLPLGGLLGLSEATINMLAEGEDGLEKLIAQQRELNTLSDEDVRLAKERQQAWFILTQKIEAAGRAVVNKLQVPLTAVLKTMGEIADKFPNIAERLPKFFADAKATAHAIAHPLDAALAKYEAATGTKSEYFPEGVRSTGGFFDAIKKGVFGPASPSQRRAATPRAATTTEAGTSSAAPETPATTGALTATTQRMIAAIRQAAQTNRDAVIGAMDRYRELIAPGQRAGFDAVLRNEGLYGATAGAGAGAQSVRTEINIGTIQVNAPNATDARGIGAALRPVLTNDALARQANPGMR